MEAMDIMLKNKTRKGVQNNSSVRVGGGGGGVLTIGLLHCGLVLL